MKLHKINKENESRFTPKSDRLSDFESWALEAATKRLFDTDTILCWNSEKCYVEAGHCTWLTDNGIMMYEVCTDDEQALYRVEDFNE